MPKYIHLTDSEAKLAAQGKLSELVRIRYNDLSKCPFGLPGDVLLAKETWAFPHKYDDRKPRQLPNDNSLVLYLASDAHYFTTGSRSGLMWRSQITMPAFAIRHRFTVTESKATQAKYVTDSFPPETWVWYAKVEARNA